MNTGSSQRINKAVIAFPALVLVVLASQEGWSEILRAGFNWNASGAGFMAFLAAFYLLWQRRDVFAESGKSSLQALLITVLSSIGYMLGITWDIQVLVHACAIFMLYGFVCCFLVKEALLALLPVCIALLFAVPIPGILNEMISDNLRMIDAKIVENIGHGFGLPITRFGTIVSVNQIPVDVGRDCDGLRLLWPLLLAAYTAAANEKIHPGVKAAVCLLALPAALALNLIRLAITTYLYGYASPEYVAHVHDILGWILIVSAGFVPFLFIAKVTEWGSYGQDETTSEKADGRSLALDKYAPTGAVIVAGCLALFSWQNASETPGHESHAALAKELNALPYKIGRWVGEDRAVPKREMEILKADSLMQRIYHRLDSEQSFLVLAAYHRDGHLANGHNAPKCYRTRGWQVATATEEHWNLAGEGVLGHSYELYRGQEKMTVVEIFSRPGFEGPVSGFSNQFAQSSAVIRYQFLLRGPKPKTDWTHHLIGQFLSSFNQIESGSPQDSTQSPWESGQYL